MEVVGLSLFCAILMVIVVCHQIRITVLDDEVHRLSSLVVQLEVTKEDKVDLSNAAYDDE